MECSFCRNMYHNTSACIGPSSISSGESLAGGGGGVPGLLEGRHGGEQKPS
jgi:hypothetical protein